MKSNYIKASFAELKNKVTWPSWSNLQSSAILVMIASAILAVVVLAMDMSFETIMSAIYKIRY
ncbi:MAG: preprotein translocase subunit SecE [Rikenellaceae bacterium]